MRPTLLLIAAMLAATVLLAACGKNEAEDSNAARYEELKEEAQQDITAENAEAEMEKIEREMANETP